MTDTDKLRLLLAKATPGPWEFVTAEDGGRSGRDMGGFKSASGWVCSFGDGRIFYPDEGTPPEPQDAALITAAVNSLPALLAKADRADALEAELAALRARVADVQSRLRHAFDYRDQVDGDEAMQTVRELANELAALLPAAEGE